MFYSSLVNFDKLEGRLRRLIIKGRYSFQNFIETGDPVVMQNKDLLRRMNKTVEKYLLNCGRRWVEMGILFSFMKL